MVNGLDVGPGGSPEQAEGVEHKDEHAAAYAPIPDLTLGECFISMEFALPAVQICHFLTKKNVYPENGFVAQKLVRNSLTIHIHGDMKPKLFLSLGCVILWKAF